MTLVLDFDFRKDDERKCDNHQDINEIFIFVLCAIRKKSGIGIGFS